MVTANNKSVGDLVAENLARAQVFEKHDIDYCCKGQRTLEEVCREQGLSVDTLVSELDSATAPDEAGDWPSASLTKLADHIVERHHTYLRSALPSVGTSRQPPVSGPRSRLWPTSSTGTWTPDRK